LRRSAIVAALNSPVFSRIFASSSSREPNADGAVVPFTDSGSRSNTAREASCPSVNRPRAQAIRAPSVCVIVCVRQPVWSSQSCTAACSASSGSSTAVKPLTSRSRKSTASSSTRFSIAPICLTSSAASTSSRPPWASAKPGEILMFPPATRPSSPQATPKPNSARFWNATLLAR
jgi:hypothetical protein